MRKEKVRIIGDVRVVDGYVAGFKKGVTKELIATCKRNEIQLWHEIDKFINQGRDNQAEELFDKVAEA